MKIQKLDAAGITHLLVIAVISISLVVAGTFTLVLHAQKNKNSTSASLSSDKSSDAKSKLHASNSTSDSHATTKDTQAPSKSSKSTPTTTTPQPATKNSQSKPKTVAPTTTTKLTPAPTVTPLSALTAVIANLLNGGTAQVTASAVAVPGPITTAHAQPIVFTANGQTYYAYRQGQAPDFNASASTVAGTMAIVGANTSGVALSGAHLDKSNNLVDANSHAAGYSTGGN